MSPPSRRLVTLLPVLLVALSAALVPGAEPLAREPVTDPAAARARFGELVSEQKYQAALELVAAARAAAKESGDEAARVSLLLDQARLEIGLGRLEGAIATLRGAERPARAQLAAICDLYAARALDVYRRHASWEIAQRERIEAPDLPVERWTAAQIGDEIDRLFAAAWAGRVAWGAEPLAELAEHLEQNSYPARIRGTLRDAVSYLWVEALLDRSVWSPAEADAAGRLDLEALLTGEADGGAATDPEAHPLARAVAVLDDLERWHRAAGRPEAAFEARRVRLASLRGTFTRADERGRLRAALEASLGELGPRWEWWSFGMADLAEAVRDEPRPQAWVEARRIARSGEAAHPDSPGGQRCRHVAAALEAPSYSVAAMASDGAGRRSIAIDHRNLAELHFRAWALDLRLEIETVRDYSLLPDRQRAEEVMASAGPAAAWSVELPPTPDLRSHRTYSVPPLERPGLYLVVASADRRFVAGANRLTAFPMVISDLVLVTRPAGRDLEATVLSGASGRAVAGAQVHLYRFDFRHGHRRETSLTTGADGVARFRLGGGETYFLLAEHAGDQALDPRYRSRSDASSGDSASALVYTDRSVYRPLQRVLWKVVAYRGARDEGRFATVGGAAFGVELIDPQGEVVASERVETNRFGSASGSFEIPAGRLLGRWGVRTSEGGWTGIAVEEYKRPTFEVTIAEPGEELRLNRQATLEGSARYYFGLPVTAGEVSWRVTREPVYPRFWWGFRPAAGTQVVASGRSAVETDGSFRAVFLPVADERLAGAPVAYGFRFEADVTDEGGETRSASRLFRLGFVGVTAEIESEAGYLAAGRPFTLTARRHDLDGEPRAGAARWELFELAQPASPRLPADEPVAEPAWPEAPPEEQAYRTPGDALRPRWETGYTPERRLAGWSDGRQLAAGEVAHGEDGAAPIELPPLPAGAYRLRYATRDAHGGEFATARELVVAAAGGTPLALPAVVLAERGSVPVGGTARLLVHSGLADQEMVLELFRDGVRIDRRRLESRAGAAIVEIPVDRSLRGGFGYVLTALRDHQFLELGGSVAVPWSDRELTVAFSTFRDRLRPGAHERWRVTVSGEDGAAPAGGAEVLAYMYDRSLDLFAPHDPPSVLGLYPSRTWTGPIEASLGSARAFRLGSGGWPHVPRAPRFQGDRLRLLDAYGIGGLGRRDEVMFRIAEAPVASAAMEGRASEDLVTVTSESPLLEPPAAKAKKVPVPDAAPPEPAAELRADFSETAFWEPHLLLGPDGSVAFEFDVPDSVTEWSVWAHAVTRDLRGGSVERRARSVKELMVRPYLPRFLREGDRAVLAVAVDNAGTRDLVGEVVLDVVDPETGASVLADFGVASGERSRPFAVAPGGGASVEFPLRAPARVGAVAVRVEARAGELGDGELRPLPLLPGRIYLAESRFAALRDADRRVLEFEELERDDDPSRLNEQLVVTLDGQLFYGALRALPYLVSYPYECTEQLLNRFVSTGILSSLFDRFPAVARMAERFAARETRFEPWAADDPNRRMALEETPWLALARGGDAPEGAELVAVLDPRIARATRADSLAKLERAQTASGGFPWWPGGPPSPYMTLYLLQAFSRALEFGVEVPRPVVERAWGYMHRHYLDELVRDAAAEDCCWEVVTFLNYVLSSYPDQSWTAGVFTAAERAAMLDLSFRHWRRHTPLSKAQLALTLARAGRGEDARLVFDSVMDSARTDPDLGTYWAPEERSWLWYNDTVEGHALALRTLTELDPDDARRHGLVQWLFLNRKLGHWKSTRATAEVLYALAHYFAHEGTLGAPEEARVAVAGETRRFRFEADRYGPAAPHGERVGGPVGSTAAEPGRAGQWVVSGERLGPAAAAVVVEKETPGLLFASATWHFSTERLPAAAHGDLLAVERSFFRRVLADGDWTLEPLAPGARLAVGDQVEVHLAISARQAAEYVHLRDPRGAGFEPDSPRSGFRWNLGIGWYEEVRDSGANFFFERLPAGEYVLKHRLRAATAGEFRVSPATLQSMYAPEFAAYSAGAALRIE